MLIALNPRSQSMKSHASPLIRHLAVSACLALFLVAPFVAQPSGGPYGPIEQFYEVPTSVTVFFVATYGEPRSEEHTFEIHSHDHLVCSILIRCNNLNH